MLRGDRYTTPQKGDGSSGHHQSVSLAGKKASLRSRSDEATAAPHATAGFTLIEVIAALSILSLTMAVVLGMLSDSFFQQRKARDLAEATSLAQSTLARVGTERPIAPGRSSGMTEAGYRWEAIIEPYPLATARDAPVVPYRIAVSVALGNSRDPLITLTTIRLGGQEARR
jgi:general secretion pathway protein I